MDPQYSNVAPRDMPASQTYELKKALAQAVGRARIQKQASQQVRSSFQQQSEYTEEAQNHMVVSLLGEIHRYLRAVDSINETPAQAALQQKFVVLYRECTSYRSMFAKATFKLDENAANMSAILQARPMHNIMSWKDWERYADEHPDCRGAGPLLEAVDWWKSVGTALENNTAEFRALRDIMAQLSSNFDRQKNMFMDLQSEITAYMQSYRGGSDAPVSQQALQSLYGPLDQMIDHAKSSKESFRVAFRPYNDM